MEEFDSDQSISKEGLPDFDFLKKNLDYILYINANNESRLNNYITLNVAVIGAIGFLYRSIEIRHCIQYVVLAMAFLSTMVFLFSLFIALNASKSRVVDKGSPMITRWISGVSEKQIAIENGPLFHWLLDHLRIVDSNRESEHIDGFQSYKHRLINSKSNQVNWEYYAIIREIYAISNVARDRAVGLKFVRRSFMWGMTALVVTFLADFSVRIIISRQ